MEKQNGQRYKLKGSRLRLVSLRCKWPWVMAK